MPSKELKDALYEIVWCACIQDEKPVNDSVDEILSTIRTAIAEADTAMLDAGCKAWGVDINADETRENIANEWRQMLAASALGEQSE